MKDFDKQNIQKKEIHNFGKNKFYHPRDIWWCRLGLNVGFEQDGTGKEFQRPILILKGLGRNVCLVVPLTTSQNKHPMRIPLGIVDNKKASAIMSQIRIIDTKRLFRKTGRLNIEKFEEIKKAVNGLI